WSDLAPRHWARQVPSALRNDLGHVAGRQAFHELLFAVDFRSACALIKPWTDPKSIADGPSILNYVRQTAAENGIDQKIRFRHKVKRASWSTRDVRWTVEAVRISGEGAAETVRFTCNFLFTC